MKKNEDILELEKSLLKLENLQASFDYLRITVASPKRMKSWAERILPSGEIVGEVLKGETINFRTHQPELNGLFCEKIFGPIKNWKCKCGQYNGFALDKVCEECNVEIIEARVRRYRMGYIELTCPVTHLWYLKGIPNYLCILLRCFDEDLKVSQLETIVYFKEGERIVDSTNPLHSFFYPENGISSNPLESFLSNQIKKKDKKGSKKFDENQLYTKSWKIQKRFGAEVLKAALESIDIPMKIKEGREKITKLCQKNFQYSLIPQKSLIRRIRILESFFATKIDPSWLILTILPVLPPNLRPLLELDSGRLVAADINEIYRLVITRNHRLFDFLYRYVAPDIISVHGRKLLQESVDSLIDNARLPKEKIFSLNNRPLKSLTEILEGKQGRFRQSLLGKRVDYSGRSVIIVGPNLRLNQCGLPYEMALELFQPFLINELLKTKIKAPSHNTKLANVIIKKNKPFIWLLLSSLTKKYSILLNRAPTLHRFGIQAFDPVLILGQAIHLHPLVCTGFNADFDGDQMAVHLPLYESSQLEAKVLMRPSYNVISPSNGEVILKPTQDMVIGCYYLTLMIKNHSFLIKKWFPNENDALCAFYQKKIELHTPILVRYRLLDFEMKLENHKLIFIGTKNQFKLGKKEILISKIFPFSSHGLKKYFVLTNLGVFVLRENNKKILFLTDLFLETTSGRLLFSRNIKNVLKQNL
jgi:DNA-directed RNA polymerase subunit beta'